MIVTFLKSKPYELTQADKEILVKYKDIINEIYINKAIPYLSIECWTELNSIAKKLGYGDSCNCSSGKVKTISRLYKELKELDYEKQFESVVEEGKPSETTGSSSEGSVLLGAGKDDENIGRDSVQLERKVKTTRKRNTKGKGAKR